MNDIITEQFVNELVRSDIWTKVDKADPINENRRETSVPDSTRAVDETEEISAQDFAVEILENVAPEVILEFVNIIHEELLYEHAKNGDADQLDEAMTRVLSKLGGMYGHARGLTRTAGAASRAAQRDVAARGARWQDVRRERGDLKTRISTDKYRRGTRRIKLASRAPHLLGGGAERAGSRKARRSLDTDLGPQPLGPRSTEPEVTPKERGIEHKPAPPKAQPGFVSTDRTTSKSKRPTTSRGPKATSVSRKLQSRAVGTAGGGGTRAQDKPAVPQTPALTRAQAGVGQARSAPARTSATKDGGGRSKAQAILRAARGTGGKGAGRTPRRVRGQRRQRRARGRK